MVFIPKAGEKGAEDLKSYRANSLTSILFKTEEKIIDLHIKTRHLVGMPLHPRQFAYQPDKSTVTALHHVVRRIENALEHKETALTAFVDIEGAFDNTGFHSIERSANSRGFEAGVVKLMSGMLRCRRISSELGGLWRPRDAVLVITVRGKDGRTIL